MKFAIEMMTNKLEGFKIVAYCQSAEEVHKKIEFLKNYYEPIGIYYRVA